MQPKRRSGAWAHKISSFVDLQQHGKYIMVNLDQLSKA